MKIQTSTAVKLVISEVPRLDPVTVFLEDLAPREGKATISCYGKSWSAWWGGMGDRPIKDFILSCDEHYLANNFGRGTSLDSTILDFDGLTAEVRKVILKDRKAHYTDKDRARDLFVKAGELSSVGTTEALFAYHNEILVELIGDEWWHHLPEKPNPDYVYLCRIINAMKAALQEAS